ncbi:MAG: chorismate synthase [Clostridia bacterium]|nr:chorismate synthase [Clostridia bacterium]
MSVYCGKNLRIEIFGASHASELGVCISGLPKGLAVNEAALQSFLRRRSPGNDPLCSKRREDDVPIFTQGITDGVTDGTVRAVIKNRDVKRQDYVNLTAAPRPGHADLAAWQKYGLDYDMSGGGPFSGRMTAALCIAGLIAVELRFAPRSFPLYPVTICARMPKLPHASATPSAAS